MRIPCVKAQALVGLSGLFLLFSLPVSPLFSVSEVGFENFQQAFSLQRSLVLPLLERPLDSMARLIKKVVVHPASWVATFLTVVAGQASLDAEVCPGSLIFKDLKPELDRELSLCKKDAFSFQEFCGPYVFPGDLYVPGKCAFALCDNPIARKEVPAVKIAFARCRYRACRRYGFRDYGLRCLDKFDTWGANMCFAQRVCQAYAQSTCPSNTCDGETCPGFFIPEERYADVQEGCLYCLQSNCKEGVKKPSYDLYRQWRKVMGRRRL